MINNRLQFVWWGFRNMVFVCWGAFHPELEIASFRWVAIGPLEVRLWKRVK